MQPVTGTTAVDAIIARRSVATQFHPLVSARKRSVVGFEALSRGIEPSSGRSIPPAELFSQAAREGRTLELDRLCRSLAIGRFAAQAGAAEGSLLSLNIDPAILAEANGSGHLINSVRSAGLSPSRVMIEILESGTGDSGALERFVRTYRDLGFLIAIDDIGTGFSNFERISLLKPDVLKLDKSLISRIGGEYHMRAIVRSIVTLSHRIGALVVAEGIETGEQALISLELGIDMLQGYYFCTPQDSIPLAMSMADEKLLSISRILKEQTIRKIDSRKKKHMRYGSIINDMIEALSSVSENDFDTVLRGRIGKHEGIECAYVIDESGIQVSDTVFQVAPPPSSGFFFQPGRRGSDQSGKDYFFLVASGLPRFTTEPYISLASRNLCITISAPFEDTQGRKRILCIDALYDEGGPA